jgi:protein SERAC1
MTVRLFEWALFAVRPLRLHEWHHILAFIRYLSPTSLAECRKSDYHTETDKQLEKQIRRISRGLLEVSRACTDDIIKSSLDTESICAGAGSLAADHGETRVVQVIHESVYDLFSSGDGFQALSGLHYGNGGCHLSIMSMCLDYLEIKELDALVQARAQVGLGAQEGLALDSILGKENVPEDKSVRSLVASTGADKRSQKFRKQHIHEFLIPGGSGHLDKPSLFDILKLSHEPAAGIDIHDWMEMDGNILDGMPPKPSSHTTSLSPTSAISQVLEDYPALLSYATSELFTHAQSAHNKGRSLDNVLHRLHDSGTWER